MLADKTVEAISHMEERVKHMPKGITLTDDLNPNKSLKQALDKLLKQNTVTDISQQDSETNMN